MTSVAGHLLRHPVQRRLCVPTVATAAGAGAVVVLPLLGELSPRSVVDAVQVTALLLALATVTAATDPVGALADASPTPGGRRLLVRAGPVLAAVAIGWSLAVVATPSGLRPPIHAASAGLAALCALVLTGAVLEARARPRVTEPLSAAAAVAMGWTAAWLLRPSWSPLIGSDVRTPVVGAVVFTLALVVVARHDLAVRWRWGAGSRPGVRGRCR